MKLGLSGRKYYFESSGVSRANKSFVSTLEIEEPTG